ncbi:MAG TPA: hypothetical protein VK803_07215 [Steroidobacteraceae bacterium]|nr:hypothetical protein [Steroidobacteraceae bacterium]
MSTDSARRLRTRNLRTLALLAALFFLPLLLAFLTYYGTPWRPAHHVNHGVLMTPPRALPPTSLPQLLPAAASAAASAPASAAASAPWHGHWSLVYIGAGACSAACREMLYVMRQTRLALDTDMTRVRRVFLATAPCCDRAYLGTEHPGLTVLDAGGTAGRALLAAFPPQGREHTLFIVDPLGNLMMSYDARQNPHGLLLDLKKLLRLSQIG